LWLVEVVVGGWEDWRWMSFVVAFGGRSRPSYSAAVQRGSVARSPVGKPIWQGVGKELAGAGEAVQAEPLLPTACQPLAQSALHATLPLHGRILPSRFPSYYYFPGQRLRFSTEFAVGNNWLGSGRPGNGPGWWLAGKRQDPLQGRHTPCLLSPHPMPTPIYLSHPHTHPPRSGTSAR
jgi:hypothetical protein